MTLPAPPAAPGTPAMPGPLAAWRAWAAELDAWAATLAVPLRALAAAPAAGRGELLAVSLEHAVRLRRLELAAALAAARDADDRDAAAARVAQLAAAALPDALGRPTATGLEDAGLLLVALLDRLGRAGDTAVPTPAAGSPGAPTSRTAAPSPVPSPGAAATAGAPTAPADVPAPPTTARRDEVAALVARCNALVAVPDPPRAAPDADAGELDRTEAACRRLLDALDALAARLRDDRAHAGRCALLPDRDLDRRYAAAATQLASAPCDLAVARHLVDGHHAALTAAAAGATPVPAAPPASRWVAEVWADPSRAPGSSTGPVPGPPEVVVLDADEVLVGRAAPGAPRDRLDRAGDLPRLGVDDPGVAGRHARLVRRDGRWALEPLEGACAVWAPGRPAADTLDAHRLRDLAAGEQVLVGRWTRLVVRPAL